jgi:hypothetical protein
MASFALSNGEQVSISDSSSQKANLSPQEALDLLRWLSNHKETLYRFTQEGTNQSSGEKHLKIHLYQEDLEHLDKLKEAIPDLRESRPIVRVLEVPWDKVTERALQLLKELQVEYTVHPLLLEDDGAFAQG